MQRKRICKSSGSCRSKPYCKFLFFSCKSYATKNVRKEKLHFFRRSCSQLFFKIVFLKCFTNPKRKHLVLIVSFDKVHKKKTPTKVFSCKIFEFFKIFSRNTLSGCFAFGGPGEGSFRRHTKIRETFFLLDSKVATSFFFMYFG